MTLDLRVLPPLPTPSGTISRTAGVKAHPRGPIPPPLPLRTHFLFSLTLNKTADIFTLPAQPSSSTFCTPSVFSVQARTFRLGLNRLIAGDSTSDVLRPLRTKLILIELECNEISVVDQITDTGGKNSGTCNKGNLRALAASLLWTCYILADSLCNLVKHHPIGHNNWNALHSDY
ncbi:hypothetical protein DFH09DRAFT_1076012 [Mycena vulgaris]|nr:hypothetical protein DFH09DRAFT_1076012 [Mycena vulgaris]